MLHKLVTIQKFADAGPRRVVARISDENIDRHGDIVVQAGLDTRNFVKTGGTVLWQHDGAAPVAKCFSLKREGAATVATVMFPDAWADAEAYEEGEPTSGDFRKMGVSGGDVVAIGAGDASVIGEAAKVAAELKAATLTAVAKPIAQAAHFVAATKRANRAKKGDTLPLRSFHGVVGVEDGRLRGFKISEAEGFRLVESEAWASPAIARRPRSAAEVLAVALAQREIVKRQIPRATGRTLTIAKIGPLGVATTPVKL